MSRLITFFLVPLLAIAIPSFLLYSSSPYFNMVDFVSYTPPPVPPLEGILAPNDKLKSTKLIAQGLEGPESVAFGKDGNIYTGGADGYIYKVNPSTNTYEKFAWVGGRSLGLDFDKNGNLIICDSLKGLLSLDFVTKQVTVLSSEANGSPIFFADDLAIAKSGKIYFSDASVIGPVQQGARWISLIPSVISILSNDPRGRLLEYDPETKQTKVLMEGLVFANGVALSKDGDYVVVAETGRPSIHKYYLTGPKVGKSEYLNENLPGIPDGIDTAENGNFYVSFYSMRTPLEKLQPYPIIKKIAVALLPFLPILPEKVGFVAELDQNGKIVNTWMDVSGETVNTITGTHEKDGKLYFGTLTQKYIGVYEKK